MDRRRCTAELGDGVGAGALQAPGWHESMPGDTAKQVKGVSWIRCATAARKPGGGVFTGGVEVLLRRS